MNGDLQIHDYIGAIIDYHAKHAFYATMAVRTYCHEVPFGCVETDRQRIVGLAEKPIIEKTISAGIYVLSPEAVADIPSGRPFPITSLFSNALRSNRECGTYFLESEWADIGTPNDLLSANGAC